MQLAAISLLWLVTSKHPAAARLVARAQGMAAVLPFLQDSSQLHRRAATFILSQLLDEPGMQVSQGHGWPCCSDPLLSCHSRCTRPQSPSILSYIDCHELAMAGAMLVTASMPAQTRLGGT